MADLATLGIRVDASGAITVLDQFGKKVGEVQQKTSLLEKGMDKLKSAAGMLGVSLSAGLILNKFITETTAAQNAMAQLEARVKSTGMAAGFSAGQLAEVAVAMQQVTTFSDEAVMGAQSLLLTFTQIKGDTLAGATTAVADLATALGGDLQGAAIQLGKALQDPTTGMVALRRSGVSFSEAQQSVIKALFDSGHQAEAQAMILKELKVEFGGAAEAARNTFGGALTGLNNSLGDLFELSTDSTSGVVGLIQEADNAARSLNEMSGAIKGVAYALGTAGLAGGIALAVTAMATMVGGVATLGEAFAAATIFAEAFWVAVTGPVGLAIAGITAVALVMAKIIGDDEKAQAAMKAREEADQYMADLALKRHKDKIKAEEDLALAKRAAALEAEAAAKKKAKEDAEELAGLEAKTIRAKALADAHEEVNKKLARQALLVQMTNGQVGPTVGGGVSMPKTGTGLSAGLGAGFGAAGAGTGLGQAGIDAVNLAAVYQSVYGKITEAAKVSATEREQIEAQFLRGMQESFAKTFEDIFTKGIKSFGDLFSKIGDLLKQYLAQLAAAQLTTALVGKKGEDGKMSGGMLSGAVNMLTGPVGWIAAGVAGIASLIGSHKKAAEAAKRQSEANIAATIAAQKAADAEAALTAARERASEVSRKWTEDRGLDDLKARQLDLDGKKDEAEAQRLWNQQVAEFKSAVDAGWSMEALAMLGGIQEAERAALTASQERKKSEDAAAAAAQAVQDAWQAVQDTINNGNDWISQQGGVLGTDPKTTFEQQSQNWGFGGMTKEQVQALYKQFTPGATLTKEEKALNDRIAAWISAYNNLYPDTTGATAGAGAGAGAALSSGGASAQTAVQATVTERTAYQLVDIGRSQVTILRMIARNTSGLARFGRLIDEEMGSSWIDEHFGNGNVGRN